MSNEKPTTLSDALATLGGIAGFILGTGVALDDPTMPLLGGIIGGTLIGAAAGKIAGVALSLAMQVAIALLLFAITASRLLSLADILVS